jgi:hypothetical protein
MDITELTYQDCKQWILDKHYAHRSPPISYAFGAIVENKIEGVCTFGIPASRFSLSLQPYELNRLVANNSLPPNSLSRFVSMCLNSFPEKAIIVSYADPNYNHHGYIYQATNWVYTGLSCAEKRFIINGSELHRKTIYNLYGTSSIAKLIDMGLDVQTEPQLGKHRYFQFTGSKLERKYLRKEIIDKYGSLPYPKGENKRYDAGDPIIQRIS